MKTARTFFYLLLATNLVLGIVSLLPFTGVRLFWTSQEGADRLSQQLSPEKITIGVTKPVMAAPPPPDTAQSGSAPEQQSVPAATEESSPAEKPETESESTPHAETASAAVAASKPVTACTLLSNLTQPDTRQLSKGAASRKKLKLEITGLTPDSYWVIIPPLGGKDGATKRLDFLDQAGFNDHYIVHDPGPNQFAISLGRFRNEEAAKRLLEALRNKKFRTARITRLDETGHDAQAKISGPKNMLDPFVEGFLKNHEEVKRDHCK